MNMLGFHSGSDGKKEYSLSIIRAICQSAGFDSTSKTSPYLLTDFMESDESVIEPREESGMTTQPVDDVGNSTQDPGDGSNDHVDATANSDDGDSEDQDDGDFGEQAIVAYLNTFMA
ncbi:uncharacterized protein FFB20_00484 [Fusarium fujikuroi]|uniref:Uncharacterized protein n=2 Tax=Fusarium fujikuroi TaxID=5127 RepID=S0DRT8_GIBF5|nr:uncharacterized protein FFUJ_04201 [Fusarium fujikuroi IMI 58289]SCN64267.1 uncharacterized protein FFB20_00484 [Fusarium fujikuroi]CCT65155.1 uncharacterized protein FFUJ_04201 [Fusarium fujikuroi IMI 58289]SCN73295.1 uncharacterized protein FFE2_02802 [Fusarium fujikuroi]SCN88642.1 uncharacterized protein FFM5_04471 [Fusarium fujikuroi]SCO04593.1 uncharacterized protein FFC1_09681 [Fusarium fujikuroi]